MREVHIALRFSASNIPTTLYGWSIRFAPADELVIPRVVLRSTVLEQFTKQHLVDTARKFSRVFDGSIVIYDNAEIFNSPACEHPPGPLLKWEFRHAPHLLAMLESWNGVLPPTDVQ